jgi:ATP-dependent helicase/nuclease subunit B
MLIRRKDWAELSPEVTDELIVRYAKEVGESLKNELMLSSARNQYLLGRIEKTLEQVVAHQRAVAARGAFRPAFVDVRFGEDQRLEAYALATPKGRELRLQGKIDRVDTIAQRGAFAILDYTLTGNSLSLERVYHGISLQLLTYLLVLQANGRKLVGKEITPAAAFYLQLLRQLEKVNHPKDAVPPDDPRFNLRIKPRGLFDERYLHALDANLESGASDVVNAYVTKDGRIGNLGRSDAGDTEAFVGLMRHVQVTMAKLADEILDGDVSVRPYRMGKITPCAHCEFRSFCRFDPAINSYHHLKKMKREEVLDGVRMKDEG